MRKLESTLILSSVLGVMACSGEVPGGGPMPSTSGSAAASGQPAAGNMQATGANANGGGVAGGAQTNNGAQTPDDVTMLDPNNPDGPVNPDNPDPPAVPAATECVPGIPATSQIPRITAYEYENIISDVFGVENASVTLPTDQAGVITKPIWDGYVNTAERTATSVMGDAAAKATLLACDATLSEDDCLVSITQNIGRQLFRRPLSDDEVAAYQEKIISQRDMVTASGSVDDTAELILSTMLKSPSFLQKAEIEGAANTDGTFSLSQHEIAARLSFMLWASVPDDVLNQAADSGQLATKDQILQQAQRMVQHENARRVVSTFHQDYLKLTTTGRWTATMKDATLYPNFKPDAVGDMIYEELALFDDTFSSGGTFQDLLTTNKAWVTPYTAPLYGLTGTFPDGEYTQVELDGTRPGFLTRIGFLAAYSNPNRTNPIVRGAYITKYVIGIDPGAPDPAAAKTQLPTDPNLITVRDKVDDMTKNQPCAGCHHTYVNPPGFVLEGFDAAGQVQTMEAASGGAVNTVADVIFSSATGPETVNNAAEMMAKLAASPDAQNYYAKKWVSFAYDRTLTQPDVCTANALSQKMAAGSYAIRDLIADLTQQDYFTTRAIEVTQ